MLKALKTEIAKLRKFPGQLFGQILVKQFGHMTSFTSKTPLTLQKGGHFLKIGIFTFIDILVCFSFNKLGFLARNVGYRLFLVLETLGQPKLAV